MDPRALFRRAGESVRVRSRGTFPAGVAWLMRVMVQISHVPLSSQPML